MYLIVIAWVYVVLMMSVVEATSSNGTLLGALITFVLYGVGPLLLVVYLMGAPARGRAIKKREAAARAQYLTASQGGAASIEPDAGCQAPGGTETVAAEASVAPVRKKP